MAHRSTSQVVNGTTIRARVIGVQGPPGLSNFIRVSGESFVASDGQEDFTLTDEYIPGTNGLLVFVDGKFLPADQIEEVDGNNFRIPTGVAAGSNVSVKVIKNYADDSDILKDWVIISESQPNYIEPEQFWFQPSTNRLRFLSPAGFEDIALRSDFENDEFDRISVKGGEF